MAAHSPSVVRPPSDYAVSLWLYACTYVYVISELAASDKSPPDPCMTLYVSDLSGSPFYCTIKAYGVGIRQRLVQRSHSAIGNGGARGASAHYVSASLDGA